VFSDGELQEGSSWEGAMMAANLHLDNLLAFIDLNDIGGLEKMSESHTAFYPLREKFESFGWESAEVNGHDCAAIHRAVAARRGGRPYALLCKTVKGRGVAFMEHVPIWHYRSPSKEEYAAAIRDLREVSA
jgi:transketolase